MPMLVLVLDDKERLEPIIREALLEHDVTVRAVAKVVLAKQMMLQSIPAAIVAQSEIAGDPAAGCKFSRELHNHESFAAVPLILVAEKVTDELIQQAGEAQVKGIVPWPSSPEVFGKRLRPLLGIDTPTHSQPAPAQPTPAQPTLAQPVSAKPAQASAMSVPPSAASAQKPQQVTVQTPPGQVHVGQVQQAPPAQVSVQQTPTARPQPAAGAPAQQAARPAAPAGAPPQPPIPPGASPVRSVPVQQAAPAKPAAAAARPAAQSPNAQMAAAMMADGSASIDDKVKRAQQILAAVLHNLKTSDLLHVVDLEDVPRVVLQMTRQVCDPVSSESAPSMEQAFNRPPQKPQAAPQQPAKPAAVVEMDLDSIFGLKKK